MNQQLTAWPYGAYRQSYRTVGGQFVLPRTALFVSAVSRKKPNPPRFTTVARGFASMDEKQCG